MDFKKENLIKSPLNYTGGKYKLLPQILPYIPNDINTFVDLFCGSAEVGINVQANRIICNDIESHIINLLKYFQDIKSDELIENVEKIISDYGLSNTSKNGYEYYGCYDSGTKGVKEYNKQKYLKLRETYNKDASNNLLFFAVIIFAFNNHIRFNSKGEFNMPSNHRDFNNRKKNNTVNFINKLKKVEIQFINKDFREFNLDGLTKNDFLYCDPPYLITLASYNEQGGWDEEKEQSLLNILDYIHKQGSRFALSNMLTHKGKENRILIEWSKKYNIHHLNSNYINFNYYGKESNNDITDEVLITNY